jgi:hypothetical protein
MGESKMDQETAFVNEVNLIGKKYQDIVFGVDIQDANFAYLTIGDVVSPTLFVEHMNLLCAAADRFDIDIGLDIDEGETPEDALVKFGSFGFRYSGDMNLFRASGVPSAEPAPGASFTP